VSSWVVGQTLMNEEAAPRKSSNLGFEEIFILCVMGVLVVVGGIGYVVAWLMGLRATTSPGHLFSVVSAQDFLAGRIPAIWGVPTPGARFDVALVLTLAAVTTLVHLAWQQREKITGKTNPQFVPMRQLSMTHLRLVTQSGGLVVVGLLWLLIVVVTTAILGDLLGGLVLGTALSAEPGLYVAYQLAGGQASVKLPKDRFVLGNSKGSFVMAPPNQGLMIFAGPRSGKSSGLVIPNVLHLDESSLVFTSTRQDILNAIAKHRTQLGKVWLYDPMHLANPLPEGVERIDWTPMSGSEDFTVALRHSEEFTHGVGEGTDDKAGFFSKSAGRLLAATLHIAAIHGLAMTQIPALIQERSLQTLLALAQQRGDEQVREIVESLAGFRELNSIQATAAATTTIFSTKFIAAPGPTDVQFAPSELLSGHHTLAIIAKSDLGGTLTASPLTTSLLTDIHTEIHRLSQAQPGGRLQVSHYWLLDEFFALGGLSALPQMASESAGRNHHLAIALQSAEQLTVLYGARADSIWDLFGTKMAGSGVSSVPTLQRLEMVGGGDAAERARQDHDSKKRPMKGDRLLSHEIAALREHHWLAISQSGPKELHPLLIRGNAYWKVSPFKELTQGIDPRQATRLARWVSRVQTARRRDDAGATKGNSLTPRIGSTVKAGIAASDELVAEQWSLWEAPVVDRAKKALSRARKALSDARRARSESEIAPPSVQSSSSAERALGMRREKVIHNDPDIGHVRTRVAYRDDEGMGGSSGSAGLPWPPASVSGLRLQAEHDPWDVLPGSTDVDWPVIAGRSRAPEAVAVATPSMPPLPAARIANRHPTKCDLCGRPVPSGEGWVWKEDGQPSWRGRHQSCPGKKG
jgi:hypothetical protein